MTDAFPKNRGGWSGPGRTAAFRLGGEGDAAWLRQRRFGAEARNKGGHLVVKLDQPTRVGLFASLGAEPTGTVVRSSLTGRAEFGTATVAVASALFLDQLFSRGDGSAFTISSVTPGAEVSSVFGDHNETASIGSYVIAPGGTPNVRPPVVHQGAASDNAGSGRAVELWPVAGARYAGKYEHAIAFGAIDTDGQHVVKVRFDDGTNIRTVVAAKVPGQIIFPLAFDRVGPGAFLGMAGTYLWNDTPPVWYDQTAAPGLFFFGTLDNGATWFIFPPAALTAHENTQYTACANSGISHLTTYNQSMNIMGAYIVPISANRALVYARLGSPDLIPVVGGRYTNSRVRVGLADLVTQTVQLIDTLYEPPFIGTSFNYNERSYWRWERGAIIAPGGGALLFFNDADDAAAAQASSPQVRYTDNGLTYSVQGNMSIPAQQAGTPLALNRTQLFMPAFIGGEHGLYQSLDRGVTWAQRAVISATATEPAPSSSQRTGPRSFNNLAWLRDNGAPKNATPAAPWVSDDRITPP